jgi:multidrug efflux pump
MGFVDRFVRRPILATVVNLIIVIAGVQAIRALNVRQYPKLESASIVVMTAYVGASADLVRGFVTTPLEQAIAAADGIDYIESQSVQGLSTINVRLKLNFDGAKALADISTRVNTVRANLPPESEIPAISLQPSDAQTAAMYLTFSSTILQPNQVTDYLIRIVQPRLTALDGVQRAEILGGRTFAIRAWLKPDRMAALNVSPTQVRNALAANNALSAVGQTKGQLVQLDLTASTDLRTVEEFRQLVVREQKGTLIRLQDIADVVLGAENYDQDVRMNGQKAVFMGVWVLPNANTLDVIGRVNREMQQLQHELPSGMKAGVAYDSTKYIKSAISEVISTLTLTVAIVIVVIFLFLGSLRTVLVPVIAIPVSLIGAVFLMQVLGFTVNLLTLLAIVLAVGLVVDDAIVVVENCERHVREGRSRLEAAFRGARELVRPIIAMTITLAAVYTPIGFQGGLTGALFREFAFALAGAVFISGIVALTLSPMMCSKLLHPVYAPGWLPRRIDHDFDWLKRVYGRLLQGTLRARGAVYVVWLALTLAVVPMYLFSPKELAPTEDQGVVFGTMVLPPNATLEQLDPYRAEVTRIFMETPEFANTFQLTLPTQAFGGMQVKPWNQRQRSIFAISNELNPKLARIAGVRAPVFLPPPLPNPGLLPIELVIGSTADHEEIRRFADRLQLAAVASGQFAFPPISDVLIDQQKVDVVLDRDKLAAMGLSLQQIGGDLAAMLGGNYVNRFTIEGRAYKVIAQAERSGRLTADDLKRIYVTGPQGQLIPLGSVASLKNEVEPRTLNRFQQLNSVKISGVPSRSVEQGLKVLEETAAKILPPGYHVDYTGGSRQLRQEGGKFLPAMALALILIFLVLAAQFNSFRDPFVILAGSAPLAMFGALIFTFLKFQGPPGLTFALTSGWTVTLNIYSEVGLVTLVGLVAKNGILIVEFANVQQTRGLSKIEAVHAGAMTRLRPILMTTIATVAGLFPLTLASGPGAAARNSIGVVLVGGMSIGTFFTLFVVPSLYVLFARDHRKAHAEELATARAEAAASEPQVAGAGV